MTSITSHKRPDWCHICGTRDCAPLADVFYPENAEHADGAERYVRICRPCASAIEDAAHNGSSHERAGLQTMALRYVDEQVRITLGGPDGSSQDPCQ